MIQEIEARFFSGTHDELRKILHVQGAQLQHPMRFMKRILMDYPDMRLQRGADSTWGFIRIRDEGDRILLTYKQIGKDENRDTYEIEEEVSSFEQTINIFEHIGLQVVAEQHTKREVWQLQECEVSLDEWPWLPPLVEIEGADEATVQNVALRLGFVWDTRIIGNSVDAYRRVYPGMSSDDNLRDIPKLTFDVMPAWLEQRKSV